MSKTILITGANGGLGTTVVEKFLSEDYKVIGVSHSDRQSDFARSHSNYEHHVVNVSDEKEAGDFIATMISKHGSIDAALLLVGGFDFGGIDEADGDALRKMYSINFESAYFTARPLFTHMLQEHYGRIVLVSAKAAFENKVGKDSIAYALSKSLIFKLAELLNATAQGSNVVCSVVAPSIINTASNRSDMPDADTSKWVEPAEIAEIMEFICSYKGDALREPLYKIYKQS